MKLLNGTRTILVLCTLLGTACAPLHLAGYSVKPNYPKAPKKSEVVLEGVSAPVTVTLRDDGIHRIEAANEADLFYVQGWLQARDRMFSMDFIRHMAQGRLTELLGIEDMGGQTTLDLDTFNRFMGFTADAEAVYAAMDPGVRQAMDSFAEGVNAWQKHGKRSLEHRLLGAEVHPWDPVDSLTIFRVLMFGLTHNYTRELRRLVIACTAGLDTMERIWPSNIEFDSWFFPQDAIPEQVWDMPPAVVPEMHEALPGLCPEQAGQETLAQLDTPTLFNPLSLLKGGIQSSNNWILAGSKTATGKSILANDPHLPQLNPPIVWGVEQSLPDAEIAGFTIVGIPVVFVGHNHHVAWGSTINNVDLQDLYVEQTATLEDGSEGYLRDGEVHEWETRTEAFHVKGGDVHEVTIRFSGNGPVLNDMDPFLADRIPPTTLRSVDLEGAGDASALWAASFARSAEEFRDGIQAFDSACMSWVYADADNIGLTSPCRVPVRPSHLGTFPVPGWDSAYEWTGYYAKEKLPESFNPEQGWIASANNRPMPSRHFPTPYNNDPSPPNRYDRIASYLSTHDDMTVEDMVALQMDTGLHYWPALQAEFEEVLCGMDVAEPLWDRAARKLCDWDGDMGSDSVAATLFTYLTHALLDRSMAVALPGGKDGEVWRFVQSIPHFETNVDWMWQRAVTDPVWNDPRTDQVETRPDTLRLAFGDALDELVGQFREDPEAWAWGDVRPFQLQHFFGGRGGVVGSVFNASTQAGLGGPETVFKNQFLRADRQNMHVMAGPALRFVADLSDLHESRFALAGGASGWPRSPYYANLLDDWISGATRPLSPRPDERDAAASWIFIPPTAGK